MYNKLNVTSKFKEFRKGYINIGNNVFIDGLHEGIDYSSELNKEQEIYNELDGIVIEKSYNRNSYGNKVVVKVNMGYFTKFFEGDNVYLLYGHLDSINDNIIIGNEIKAGDIIGYMGNTGYCLTKIDKIHSNGRVKMLDSYRRVTEEESKDKKFFGGVHLHLSVFCNNAVFVDKIKKKLGNEHIYQWGKYWINPEKFFEMIKEYEL